MLSSGAVIALMLVLLGDRALAGEVHAVAPWRGGPAHPAGTEAAAAEPPLVGQIDPRVEPLDYVVYRLLPESRLEVRTGKAGLFGFAGHAHVIRAGAFQGTVVYRPGNPYRSTLDIRIPADSLKVLTPPDTAEIRKVTETMRTQVLRTAEYPEIRLVSRRVVPSSAGFHLVAALTLAGQTRDVPIEVTARVGADTLEAAATFSVKQSDFGIKPVSAGPGGTVKVADRVTFDIRVVAARERSGMLSVGR
jgi:polyisoprenoid-binding protein YceI